MENKIKKCFNGFDIYTFIWNGRPCWLANNIVEMLGYANASKTIKQCIEREKFRSGINGEYEELGGTELKLFKEIMSDAIGEKMKYVSKIFVFYEKGLYGFLQYTAKPVGVTFRFWIREEVLPELKAKGMYILEDSEIRKKPQKKKNLLQYSGLGSEFDIDKFQRLRLVNESVKSLEKYLDKIENNDLQKLKIIQTLYLEVGIELPMNFTEEDFIS